MPDPTGRLPEETLSAEALRLHFAAMGMSPQELVVLSGAHTVCTNAHETRHTLESLSASCLLIIPFVIPRPQVCFHTQHHDHMLSL